MKILMYILYFIGFAFMGGFISIMFEAPIDDWRYWVIIIWGGYMWMVGRLLEVEL